MRKATLVNDVNLMGYGVIRKGEKFDTDRVNKRFAYLQIKPGVIARVKRSDVIVK